MARDIIIPSLSNLDDIIGVNPNNLPGISSAASSEDTAPEGNSAGESSPSGNQQAQTTSQPNSQEKISLRSLNKGDAKYREKKATDKPAKGIDKANAKVGAKLKNLSSDKDWLSFLQEAENVKGHDIRLVRVSLTPEMISALIALRIEGIPTNRALAAAFQLFINAHKNELNQIRKKLLT
mgnify:FL=1